MYKKILERLNKPYLKEDNIEIRLIKNLRIVTENYNTYLYNGEELLLRPRLCEVVNDCVIVKMLSNSMYAVYCSSI
jgi:hypothetical protein